MKEERKIDRFHGIDRHKQFSTISVLNREGQEITFLSVCLDLKKYIENLGSSDAMILEASTGTFWWADQIEAQGALCYILDPHKFKIIKDSWNKTDKHDARNMAKALWVYLITGEFGIPTVYKPQAVVRELRRLFTQYALLNRQICMHKNNIQAILSDNGVHLLVIEKERLLNAEKGCLILKDLDIAASSRISIQMSQELLWKLEENKELLGREIILAGEPFQNEVKLLMTIKGITPLTALAFLSDIGDIRRFKSLRKMYAYLGLVPKSKDSGGKSRPGHINRESRKLTRTILTQSVFHISNSSPYLNNYYSDLTKKRGAGRARIALIRKICGIMRRMLLTGKEFRWVDKKLYEKKFNQYVKTLQKLQEERKSA